MYFIMNRRDSHRISLTVFIGIIFTCGSIYAITRQEIRGLSFDDIAEHKSYSNDITKETSPPTRVYLCRAVGNLEVNGMSTTDTYEAYFHIPIAFNEQIPILIEVEGPMLIDYRFIQLSPPNVIVAARMNRASSALLDWTAWVLVKENTYSDLPSYAPIPTLGQLPDSVKKWLVPTDCVQSNDALVQQVADSVRDTTTNLMSLADRICYYCDHILWQFPHLPRACDAVYAIKWGNSCTGHAHAGAALFRANGVPARTLLNIPCWSSYYDMHWIIDYYVPEYGWVRMETAMGQNPYYPEQEIVTLACNPEDEFTMFYPYGVEAYWHTSDPIFPVGCPDWNTAHIAYYPSFISDSTEKIEHAHALTDSVFNYYSEYYGIYLTPVQQALLETALDYQASALANIQASDLDGYISDMHEAKACYEDICPASMETLFLDDFESGVNDWTHGGSHDEWELGVPSYGPTQTHSAVNCWGIDLDNTYENNADCWLLSPVIDLTGYACAYLSFWVWNWVQDACTFVNDPLWLDITTDGTTFYPLCSKMGGVNDDPEIPDVGGWSRVVLDLTKYLDNHVQIRFRFRSDANNVQAGSYVDDVHVYGRYATTGKTIHDEQISCNIMTLKSTPNPFSGITSIDYVMNVESRVVLKVYSCTGRLVKTLVDDYQESGPHSILWNSLEGVGEKVPSGIYFLNMKSFSEDGKADDVTRKIVKIK